jgi:hypothetical protein
MKQREGGGEGRPKLVVREKERGALLLLSLLGLSIWWFWILIIKTFFEFLLKLLCSTLEALNCLS